MPFDPTWPTGDVLISDTKMKEQFNGLHDEITAISAVTDAQVDGVNTLNPGYPATASVNLTGNVLHFAFEIPRGDKGDPGDKGDQGDQGPPGNAGGITLDVPNPAGGTLHFVDGVLVGYDP